MYTEIIFLKEYMQQCMLCNNKSLNSTILFLALLHFIIAIFMRMFNSVSGNILKNKMAILHLNWILGKKNMLQNK